MSYKYAVVWCTNAKSYMEGSPRPRLYHVNLFNSFNRATKFASEWNPPATIYELIG